MGLLNILFGNQRKHVDVASLNRDLEILNDCARLIENTTNPEVFFSRYELYMNKLSILSNAEKLRQVKVTGESFCQKYEEMNTEDKKVEFINDFMDRMWTDTCRKAEGLKTDKGKQNRYTRFFTTLQTYEEKMPEQCIQHYKALTPVNLSQLTELQIFSQRDSLHKNGYTQYEFIAEPTSCPVCKALDGKAFPLDLLTPGVNAPPMCENCRCTIAAHEDRKEFDEWLDFINKGGTTKEWNKLKKK